MSKKLYRSKRDVMVCGVCGGIDPTIVRLIAVALILSWGTGLFAYLIGAVIIPKNPYQ